MIKYLFIFMSSLINYFYKPNDFIVVKDEFVENREIIDDQNGYVLYYDYKEYVLETDNYNASNQGKDNEFKIIFEGKVISYYVYDNIYVIEEINNYYSGECKYYLKIYNLKGKLIKENLLDSYIDCYSVKIIKYKGEIILLGNILNNNSNNNIFVYELAIEKFYYLGSDKEEKLIDAVCDNWNLYLFIKKDKITEGIFGNGPEYLVCKLNKDNDKYLISNISYIEDFNDYYHMELIDNNIYVVSQKISNSNKINGIIRMFNLDLNYLCSYDISSFKDLYFGLNGLIIVFCDGYEYLVDGKTLTKIKEISVLQYLRNNVDNTDNKQENTDNINNYVIRKFSDKFFFKEEKKTMYFDIIDLRSVNIPQEYNHFNSDYEDDESVFSFFGNCNKYEREYDKYFDKVKCGDYNFTIKYETIGNIVFNLGYTYNITPRINVKEGMIYKTGYQLKFNGDCTLDGQNIYNNYSVYDEGKHVLILEGEGITKEVCFYISNLQIEFTDKVRMKGQSVYLGSSFTIDLKLSNYDNYVIKEIDCKGIRYETYTFENGILSIKFNAPSSPNDEDYESSLLIYNYLDIYLNSITFKVYGSDYVYNINKVFRINFVYDDLEINKNGEGLVYTFNVDDKNSLVRAIEVELVNEYGNKTFVFPISNQSLELDSLYQNDKVESGVYKVYYNLYYDNNGEYKKENLLVCDMLITSGCSVGKVSVNFINNKVELLNINLLEENNNVYRVKLDNKITYEVEDLNVQEVVVYSVVSFGGLLVLGLLLKRMFSRKSKREFI